MKNTNCPLCGCGCHYTSSDHDEPPLPPGYQFNPSDQEIVSYYLSRKISGKPNHPLSPIDELPLYGVQPHRLFSSSGSKSTTDKYVFTQIKKKFDRGDKFERGVAGGGTWKQEHTHPIKSPSSPNLTIGYRTNFSFVPNKPKSKGDCTWVMHEYRLERAPSDSYSSICRIKRGRAASHSTDAVTHSNDDDSAAAPGLPHSRSSKRKRSAKGDPISTPPTDGDDDSAAAPSLPHSRSSKRKRPRKGNPISTAPITTAALPPRPPTIPTLIWGQYHPTHLRLRRHVWLLHLPRMIHPTHTRSKNTILLLGPLLQPCLHRHLVLRIFLVLCRRYQMHQIVRFMMSSCQ